MTILKAACIQLSSGPDIVENLRITSDLIREAAAQGARFIATPENTCHMCFPLTKRLATAQTQDDHETLQSMRALAKELGVSVLIGSLGIKLQKRKLANRSFLIDPSGEVAATYDKIHLFDVDLPNGESYRESAIIEPGDQLVVPEVLGVRMGLSICYDVRFAPIYRAMAKAGAQILMIPAAFSVPTGKAHWEILLRARAIETGSYVMAPAQGGEHEGGRHTWGHSMIIGPWGEILAERPEGAGIIMADLDMEEVLKARSAIPALTHDREFKIS